MTAPVSPLADYRRAEFRTNRYLLRPACAQDQQLMFGWRSDAETSRYLAAPAPQSIESQLAWFDRVCRDTAYSYHIVEDGGVPIGFTSMFNADPSYADAEWGVVMGKQRAPGAVRIFAPLCCLCAFKFGGLAFLYTCINENNSGAVSRVRQMGAKLYEEPSVYRKQGELLFRISAEEFLRHTLPGLADDSPQWTDALNVEMHLVDTVA
ncbi:MAG: GNAT family N-acetyltransferase [Halioglobus sp.]|nr:GNAT family N-acetyltransferase [Halioglobus sp.]